MKIVTINPFSQPEMVRAIASAYQQSFGGTPWNEGYICPVCETTFARDESILICPLCEKQSQIVLKVEYWPTSKVITDFYREMKKPDPVCVVAQEKNVIVGFAWGYNVSASPDLDQHLDAPGVHTLLQGDFFYLDECALTPPYQGKGIGKILVDNIFHEQKQKQILLRTMNHSRMFNVIKQKGGSVIQHISRDRVIMRTTVS